eukprot:g35624.t1
MQKELGRGDGIGNRRGGPNADSSRARRFCIDEAVLVPTHSCCGRGAFGPGTRLGGIGSGCFGEMGPKLTHGGGGVAFRPVRYPATSVMSTLARTHSGMNIVGGKMVPKTGNFHSSGGGVGKGD